MYTNVNEVRTGNIIFNTSNITDTQILSCIQDSASLINVKLNKFFKTPLTPNSYKTGTISGTISTDDVIGLTSSFTSELNVGDYIKIIDTSEILKVLTIISDTSLTTSANIVSAFTNSNFYVIPREIATANKFLAMAYLLLEQFPEKSDNQDSTPLDKRYENRAMEYLNAFIGNGYYNSDFEAQEASKTKARIYYYGNTQSDTFINNQNFINEVNGNFI